LPVKATPSETAQPKSILSGSIGLGALVACATVVAYLPALRGGFIWNDSDYVTAPALRSLGGLVRIWVEPGATQQYYPLLHSAFWVEHRLFGDRPLGYHAVTLLLHAGSAVLFALVLRRLLSGGPAAWLAALLFALHPVHVESVAWITEQKNTLSLALYLGAALAYLRFDQTRRPGAYALALSLFVLSLLCKSVTATLPAALLVVFWWKRGRLSLRRDALALLPWLALGAAAGLFSSWVEKAYVGAQGADFDLSAAGRVLVAGRAIWFYMGKLAWPVGLNFVYPRWSIDAAAWWQWLFPLGVLAGIAGLWALRRLARGPLAAFLIFVGSLFPALSFVNLYGARYSWVWDHWQYLPDLSLLALAAAGLVAGWRLAAPALRPLGPALAAALAVLLGTLTWARCAAFADSDTLWRTTLARNPSCWMAFNNLGLAWSRIPGRLDDAVAEYQEALRLNPNDAEAHNNLGNAWSEKPGRLNDAAAEYEESLRLEPNYAEPHNNLGSVLSRMPGRLADAVAQYQEALRLKPNYPEAHNNLGNVLSRMPGRLNDAVAQFEEALRLKPDDAKAHNNLGDALSQMPGRLSEAVAQYEEALRLQPGLAEAHNNLGSALLGVPGRVDDAIAQYEEALRIRPDFAEAHYDLGLALAKAPSRLNEAVVQFEEALRIRPDFAEAHYDLGNAWLRIPGRHKDAVAQYEEALRLKPDDPAARHAMAEALKQARDN
jgi:tetratricopeptide (TPR) repeat protein